MDPDVDLHVPAQRRELDLAVLAAISAGGVLGALARYGVAAAWPHPAGGFPWSTLLINVSGCFLIGVLMVIVTRVTPQQRLLRPFAGVGVLGGYTTFSTYIVDIYRTTPWAALAYLGITLVGAMTAVWAGAELADRATNRLVKR
ncbi:fluoride efflux transporter FluC [Paractinoplanes durhamensis]|uniref:Fluoride-specific ion channel FluC n=1 Tax=Paractinoplanes durhamensis TaxID=113563 RepID=A0ABQ3YZJ1_9ACTN|nr:CrcB family protein [Actinoplanes durhamensis]GIE03004.1 putative fluoride ion transporter CrcB 1 [Actinoplanes durhamensis]